VIAHQALGQRLGVRAILATLVSLVMVGCGGATFGPASARSGGQRSTALAVEDHVTPEMRAKALAFTSCMRLHGIPAPDPIFERRAITIVYPRSVDAQTEQFKTAQASCMGTAWSAPATPG
jgi:hypothetical protein